MIVGREEKRREAFTCSLLSLLLSFRSLKTEGDDSLIKSHIEKMDANIDVRCTQNKTNHYPRAMTFSSPLLASFFSLLHRNEEEEEEEKEKEEGERPCGIDTLLNTHQTNLRQNEVRQ